MKGLKIIGLSVGFLFILGCKKDQIDIPQENAPVFSVSGTFNGEAISLVAGDDGAYMHTMTKSENGVNVFSGIISSDNLSFEVGVFDGNLDVENIGIPSTNIAPIYASTSSIPLATLSKSVFQNASVINYIRWFIDGVDSGMNDVPIFEAGKYEVCAEIHYQDGSDRMLCNDIIVGFNHNATYDMQADLLGNGIVKTSIGNPSDEIVSVEWFVNDVLIQTSDTFQYYFSDSPQKLTSRVRFENGSFKTKSMLVNGYYFQKNVEDFTIFENQSPGVVSRDFNIRVNVLKDGATYKSDLANNVSSSVIISDISYFGVNNAGKSVYKISGIIACKQRKEGTTTDVDLNVNFVFGIEIP